MSDEHDPTPAARTPEEEAEWARQQAEANEAEHVAAEAEARRADEPAPDDAPDPSRGAQVVLDPDSDAAKAARGGAAPDMAGNVVARDADLIKQGYDPASPSGESTDKA